MSCLYMDLANSFYGSSPLWLLHHKIGPKTILVINQCSIGDIATYSHHHSRIHVLAQVWTSSCNGPSMNRTMMIEPNCETIYIYIYIIFLGNLIEFYWKKKLKIQYLNLNITPVFSFSILWGYHDGLTIFHKRT
jgi:hypothetical protein